jgi:hypothetical protein
VVDNSILKKCKSLLVLAMPKYLIKKNRKGEKIYVYEKCLID